MSKISIALYGSQNSLFLDAMEALLVSNPDFVVTAKYHSIDEFMANYKGTVINVFIITFQSLSEIKLALLKKIKEELPSIKVLMLSLNKNENVLQVVKSGASGYLTQNSSRHEVFQAILSLRNGYDYYSNSITGLLMKNYMETIDADQTEKTLNGLSTRELEILKCWGEGLTNKEIADKLFISIRTVESHKNHVMQKLKMKTMVDVVKFAIKNNIIKI